jgi:hypothetical protein
MSKLYESDEYLDLPRLFAIQDAEALLEGCVRRLRKKWESPLDTMGDFLYLLPKCRTREVEPLPLHIAPDPRHVHQHEQPAHQLASKQARLHILCRVSDPSDPPSTRKRAPSDSRSLCQVFSDLDKAEHLKRHKKKGQ